MYLHLNFRNGIFYPRRIATHLHHDCIWRSAWRGYQEKRYLEYFCRKGNMTIMLYLKWYYNHIFTDLCGKHTKPTYACPGKQGETNFGQVPNAKKCWKKCKKNGVTDMIYYNNANKTCYCIVKEQLGTTCGQWGKHIEFYTKNPKKCA